MLTIEIADIQTGNVGMTVGVRHDGGGLQTLVILYLATFTHDHSVSDSLETDRPVSIQTAREQTWQGRDSCSGLTQLVKSWESSACQKLGDIEHVRGPC